MTTVRHLAVEHDFSQDDVFICVMMSHGSQGRVIGVDMEGVEVETVKKIFSRVEALSGKPKIFFVAACQGSKLTCFNSLIQVLFCKAMFQILKSCVMYSENTCF